MQGGRAHADIRHRFGAEPPRVLDKEVRAHGTQDVDHADPGRIHADLLERHVGTWRDAGTDQKEGRRGDIAWHRDRRGPEPTAAVKTDAIVAAPHLVAERRQHAFGVIAGRRRFADAGLAVGIQPREQQARFDLRTGHRHHVIDPDQGTGGPDVQRRRTLIAAVDAGAHARKRISDAPHRPPRQRCIAGQRRREGLTAQQTAQQPHRGAGIAHIQHRLRRPQAVQTDAGNAHATRVRPLDAHAHGTKGR